MVSAQLPMMPGGTFTMGSASGSEDEKPEHSVTLSGYSMTSYEISEAAYEACVARGVCSPAHYNDSTCRAWNGSSFIRVRVPQQARNPQFPVVCVTWFQAQQYCHAHGMKLPTESQWEYAARAGGTGRYSWDDGIPTAEQAVLARKTGPDRVGITTANRWQLYDMIGNVWEWVNDYYDPEAYQHSVTTDPQGPEVGLYRVIRGGGWYSSAAKLSVSNRQWFSPDYSEVSIGFRCVSSR